MKLIAKLLIVCLVLISISACTNKPGVQLVPQKCTPATVELPTIDNTKYPTGEEEAKKAISNYEKMKNYAYKLLESIEVCK